MILVTVGAQRPFDRLVGAVDRWAQTRKRSDVFAQIGLTAFRPEAMAFTAFMDLPEFRKKVELADVVVAHAGLGSILAALEFGKPILIMPRRGDLHETDDDNQLAAAERFLAEGRIDVAFNEQELLEKLDNFDRTRPHQPTDSPALSAVPITPRACSEINSRPSAAASLKEVSPPEQPAPAPLEDHSVNGAPVNGRPTVGLVRGGRTWAAAKIKARISAVILLAGRLRATDLSRRVGRSRLDLPIDHERSLLAFWREETIALANAWKSKHLTLRVLLDQASPVPTVPVGGPGVTLSLERDITEFRGTAGVLRDACADYDDDDWVLVANAAQLLFGSLRSVADRMADAGGDINVVHDSGGLPNGLILLRCGVLRAVPVIGYHDLKEQVIPSLAKRHPVKVIRTHGITSQPIHSLKDYTEALRCYHGRHVGNHGLEGDSWSERWQPRFSICEAGAAIAPSAVIHDSVILQDAIVDKRAVVVRSVVGRGARIRSGERVVDQIVV